MSDRDFLLLDGDCGLCHRLATFMDKRLARGQDIGYRPILSEEGQEMIATLQNAKKAAGCGLCLPNQKWKIIHSLSSRNPLFTLHEMVLQNVVPNFLDYPSAHPRHWLQNNRKIPSQILQTSHRVPFQNRLNFLFSEGLTIFEVIRPIYGSKKSSNSKPSKSLVNKQT